MASEVPSTAVNGGPSTSLAAMLEQQHARDEAHKATVEDVVDEDDIQHPPPSSLEKDQKPDVLPQATAQAETATPAPAPNVAPKQAPAFDVQSEELFPALGSGPKPKAAAAMPTTWGAKKPSAVTAAANGLPNGSQGRMFAPSAHSYMGF